MLKIHVKSKEEIIEYIADIKIRKIKNKNIQNIQKIYKKIKKSINEIENMRKKKALRKLMNIIIKQKYLMISL